MYHKRINNVIITFTSEKLQKFRGVQCCANFILTIYSMNVFNIIIQGVSKIHKQIKGT